MRHDGRASGSQPFGRVRDIDEFDDRAIQGDTLLFEPQDLGTTALGKRPRLLRGVWVGIVELEEPPDPLQRKPEQLSAKDQSHSRNLGRTVNPDRSDP